VTLLPEGFGHFVTSIAAPVASGWSDLAGWGFHPLESAALARRTDKADIGLIYRDSSSVLYLHFGLDRNGGS
jgi:hypothetical protein